MIETEDPPLSYGREFELEIFGVSGQSLMPPHLDFPEAIQDVVRNPIKRVNQFGEIETYDPFSPTWGKTGEMWELVNSFLPRRCEGERSGPLSLHISLGRSLDYHHGIDCFFWWMGTYISVDVSTALKRKEYVGKEKLKADMLLNPKDICDSGLFHFAKELAEAIKKRRKLNKIIEHKRHPHR